MLSLIFSVMPMFVCLSWVVLLLIDSRKNLSKQYLAFFLFLSVINYFAHAAFFNRQFQVFAFMENIWVFTSLAGYPMYYYYIRLLTVDAKIRWQWIWLLAPSLLLSAFSFVVYFAMSPQELDMYIRGVMYHETGYSTPYPPLVKLQLLRMLLFKIVFFVQVFVSLYFGYRLIVRYNKQVKDFYSDTVDKDLSPIKWVLAAFVFASTISLLSNTIGKDFFVDKDILLAIPSVTHSVFLFFIGYVGYHQNFTVVDFMRDVNEYERQDGLPCMDENGNVVDLKNGDKVKQQLIDLMEKDELFKNPELRISDVALILCSNRSYVSRIVNNDIQTNFCDFVNSYRLSYAEKLMNEPEFKHLSLSQIAQQSGFLSESSFYRVFKEKKGISPGKYRGNV